MNRLIDQLSHEKRITLEIRSEVKDFLADKWRDPQYGARPLKRAIQRYVLDAIAMAFIEGTIQEGTTVVLQIKEGKMVVTGKK
jgi:ATP-dependent Clp protease ATP-binding subunit ClpB